MGTSVPNLILKTDYAVQNNPTVLEFHMDLPVPDKDKIKVQEWLWHEDWTALSNYLGAQVPHLRVLVSEWVNKTEERKRGKALQLAASAS